METFTTYDGLDGNNIRAEVYVQKGEGLVTEIKESGKGTADVSFKVGNLKFPVHGWVNMDTAIFEEAKKAHETQQTVAFRIESQRKSGVERITPIQQLRESMSSAKKNIITILASINNVVSSEAVTLPEEDPEPTKMGRVKAQSGTPKPLGAVSGTQVVDVNVLLSTLNNVVEQNLFTPDVVANLVAQALTSGATVEQVRSAVYSKDREDNSFQAKTSPPSFSVEAPSWKGYNSDGRSNLGHATVLAAAGVETYVRHYLNNHTTLDFNDGRYSDAVNYFSGLLLSVADKIQSLLYGSGFRPDRAASSHVKIRGIVFDTVDNYYNIPFNSNNTLNPNDVEQWVKNVGNLAYQRYKGIIQLTNAPSNTSVPVPSSLRDDEGLASQAEVSVVDDSPVNSAPDVVEPVMVEAAVEEVSVEDEPDVEVPAVPAAAESVVVSGAVKYPQTLLDEEILKDGKLVGVEPATQETINMFKDMVEEFNLSKTEISKISRLLAWTFGPKFVKAQLIPDEQLLEFIDFYVASGSDNFQEALKETT
jgi:hypothetical protein